MAAGIVYLDVGDEITSAAARIRSSTATRVALVVPYGSRIATSRMNFRLLSREAVVSNRRLSIISGDAASRSLAASAGLPVFGSVTEYEGAVDTGSDRDADDGGGSSPGPSSAATTLAESETVAAVGPIAEAAASAESAPEAATAPIAVPTPTPTRDRREQPPAARQLPPASVPTVIPRAADRDAVDE